MKPTQCQLRRMERALLAGLVFAILVPIVACSTSHRPRVELDLGIERPDKAVLLISIDGVAVPVFDHLLADGRLPNIQTRLIDEGVRVRRAVTVQPTITYAAFTSILTGRFPGSHGIVGNKWFDRYAILYRDYISIYTYRQVGDDYLAPTIFESLPKGARSASIQSPNRRGADRTIDNWATAGVNWFLGNLEGVDRLVPLRMELISASSREWKSWPTFIHAYMPGVDEIGHRFGSESEHYRRALINADVQVGRFLDALQDTGMLDRTFVFLVSDHGHTPTGDHKFFDVAAFLREHGLNVLDRDPGISSLERRREYLDRFDAVLAVGGERRAAIHLRGEGGWHERPTPQTVENLLRENGAGSIWSSPAVHLAIAPRIDPDTTRQTVEIYSRTGHARIEHRHIDGVPSYSYEVLTEDPLHGEMPQGWRTAKEWLRTSGDSEYPDLVVALAELFESPRAGDIMLTAMQGWDFNPNGRGGHGGVDARDMLVPLIVRGPGVPRGAEIPCARTVDIMPTILSLLGKDDLLQGGRRFDGVDRAAEIRAAAPATTRGD